MTAASFYVKVLDIMRGTFPQSGIAIGVYHLKAFPRKVFSQDKQRNKPLLGFKNNNREIEQLPKTKNNNF